MEPQPRPEAQDQQDVTEETAAPAADTPPAAEPVTGTVTDAPTTPEADAPADRTEAQAEVAELKRALSERTNDLKRLQAEYVNYKRRVDRDRDVARNAGVESVIVDLTGVLDTIRIAQQHEELTDGFRLLVDELEKVTTKNGLEIFGEKGQPFDPQVHDALMQAPMPGATAPTVLDVMQVGYRFKGRVLRPARVAVGMPTEDEPAEAAPTTDGSTSAGSTSAGSTTDPAAEAGAAGDAGSPAE